MAYIPCAAHNIQLVLKDGLTFDADFSVLINQVSKDIVSKSKFSILIAEELRSFDKKLCKRVVTRWNSVLFMIRSVLKVSIEEFDLIKSKLRSKAVSLKKAANSFSLSLLERCMPTELCSLLALFEFVTDELQGDVVTISRVYPAVKMLQTKLVANLNDYVHTVELRKKLLQSLNERFSHLIVQDLFIVSTFLDPNFGLSAFSVGEKPMIKTLIKRLCEASVESNSLSSCTFFSSASLSSSSKKTKYIYHNDDEEVMEENDSDKMVNDYIRVVHDNQQLDDLDNIGIDALVFWKKYESVFPILAKLAKKYLSVQASSAAVERMFSICGHIF